MHYMITKWTCYHDIILFVVTLIVFGRIDRNLILINMISSNTFINIAKPSMTLIFVNSNYLNAFTNENFICSDLIHEMVEKNLIIIILKNEIT